MDVECRIRLSPEDRERLNGWVAGRNWAAGAGVTAIVRATVKTEKTAYRCRARDIERGVRGLERATPAGPAAGSR